MKKENNQEVVRPHTDDKSIRSEIIKVRFTKEPVLLNKEDCKAVKSPYIPTYHREYYFKTKKGELVVINTSVEYDLKNIENVILIQSKVNTALSLLNKYKHSMTLEKKQELDSLLKEVMDELHTIKARLRG